MGKAFVCCVGRQITAKNRSVDEGTVLFWVVGIAPWMDLGGETPAGCAHEPVSFFWDGFEKSPAHIIKEPSAKASLTRH